MAKLTIELLGSEVLRRRATDVPAPGPELDRLIADMFETMYDAGGIGLAAPQVGISQRLLVVDVKEDDSEPFALLDARVVESGAELEKMEEGCLSIPGVSGVVERPFRVVVEGTDPAGNAVRVEATEMLGRCLQHEIDHLDGILFIDRLSPLKRDMVLRRYRKQK